MEENRKNEFIPDSGRIVYNLFIRETACLRENEFKVRREDYGETV